MTVRSDHRRESHQEARAAARQNSTHAAFVAQKARKNETAVFSNGRAASENPARFFTAPSPHANDTFAPAATPREQDLLALPAPAAPAPRVHDPLALPAPTPAPAAVLASTPPRASTDRALVPSSDRGPYPPDAATQALAGLTTAVLFAQFARRAHAPAAPAIGRTARRLLQEPAPTIPKSTTVLALGKIDVNYWSRPSPFDPNQKNNFYAVGQNVPGDGWVVSVHDTNAGAPKKSVLVTGNSYDPTWNKQGLVVHQGAREDGSAVLVPYAVLRNAIKTGTQIGTQTPGVVSLGDGINAYQDVAPGSSRVIWPQDWQSDPGDAASNRRDPLPNAGPNSHLTVAAIENGRVVRQQDVKTPYAGDWQMAADGKRLVARLTKKDAPEKQNGYQVYQVVEKNPPKGPIRDFESTRYKLEKLEPGYAKSLRGGKAQVQGNVVLTHHAITKADRKYYPALSDRQFENLLEKGSGDLFTQNVKTGVTKRWTNSGPGAYAKYPDFLSDARGNTNLRYQAQLANGEVEIRDVRFSGPPRG